MKAADFGKVAVLMGGRSAEREISLKSGMAVLKALVNEGVDAHAFDPAAQPITDLLAQSFDRVFIALHGRGGEDGSIQGALEALELPYTGSGVLGCALAMDKVRTKQIWQAAGLPTARSIAVDSSHIAELDCEQVLTDLGGRVIVKPAQEGSSIGMAIAANAEELRKALQQAAHYDQRLLVETWLQGPEYTVALLDNRALPVIRLQTSHAFYDYDAKYQANDTQYHCPAGLSESDELAVRSLAKAAFLSVAGSGWGRVDLMADSEGRWQLLEVNTVPGMTEKSLVPMAAKAAGISFGDLTLRILEQTME